MPLLLRALPLSLKTFWRYLLLLPVLAVVGFVVSIVTLFIPFAGMIVPGTLSALFILLGLRCALAARGHRSGLDLEQLLYASLVFFALNSVAVFLADLIAGAATVISFPEAFRPDFDIDEPGMAGRAFLVVIGVLSLKQILLAAYSVALAVPMTNVAAGSNRRSQSGFLYGIGTGWFSLAIASLVWAYGGAFFALFGEVVTMFGILASAVLAYLNGTEIPWVWSTRLDTLMGGTLFMTWASSWFFSIAVLAWEKAGESDDRKRSAEVLAQRTSAEDLRALREARQRR